MVRSRGAATGILLARADGPEQEALVGRQFAGRVGLFLEVDVDRLAAGREDLPAVAAGRPPPIPMSTPSLDGRPPVLVVIGDAAETLDTLYPYHRLIEAGYRPVVAAPEKRLYQMVMHEVRPGWTITREWEGYQLEADIAFRDVDEGQYLGVFFSGGRAPEYIREDQDLLRITRHFFDEGKPIASVCHGVEIPARAGRVRGRRMATVPKCRFDLEVCGGVFVDEPCVVDGNLVSGRTYHDHGHYMGAWIALLDAARSAES